MATPGAGRGLRALLRVMSLVMVVAGAGTVVLGVDSLAGAGDSSSVVDSELRFTQFGTWSPAWSCGARARMSLGRPGLCAWSRSRSSSPAAPRLLSWVVTGRPHWSQIVLLIIELVIPFVIIPWQAATARAEGT